MTCPHTRYAHPTPCVTIPPSLSLKEARAALRDAVQRKHELMLRREQSLGVNLSTPQGEIALLASLLNPETTNVRKRQN